MNEKLPKRPTAEDWKRVQAQGIAERRERNDRLRAMDQRDLPEEPGRTVESFPLSGFFDKTSEEEIRVGKDLLFKVPSVADMEKLYQHIRETDMKNLLEIDYKYNSNYRNSFKNVSYWVERGAEKLREADYCFTVGQEWMAQSHIQEARRSLTMAQETSEALGRRYFPGHYR